MNAKSFVVNDPDWKRHLPQPVFDEKPEYVALYDRAWELAHDHVREIPGMPQTPYMDEAFSPADIWIWDTCFMSFFCKYAPHVFPGVESFNNFYAPLHDGSPLPKVKVCKKDPASGKECAEMAQLRIHIPDNPPLFAWAEYAYALMTGDRAHLETLLLEKQYLQRHFAFLEKMDKPGFVTGYTRAPTCLVKQGNGYFWEGGRSGMDNTPRGRTAFKAEKERPNNPEMLWVDAIAQQGLSALCIARIAALLGAGDIAAHWEDVYDSFKEKVNALYWDEEDGIYYDINCRTLEKMKCLTPASFWPMLAMMPSGEQAERMCDVICDPRKLGGAVPWTSVSRSDPDYVPEDGEYWRGAVWLPTAYMGIKSLENYGKFDLANGCARKIMQHMYRTYSEYEPHTIWECYNPEKPVPANHRGKRVRPDFCGWSALGPISLFIENVIGITGADAFQKKLTWNLPPEIRGRIGVKNYAFGEIVTDTVYCDGVVQVKANLPYTLVVNGKAYPIAAGENRIHIG